MHATFMVLCENGGRLSRGGPVLYGIFRNLMMPQLPHRPAPFHVAIEVEAEPHEAGDHELLLRFIDPDGRTLHEEGLVMEFRRRPDMRPTYCFMCEPVSIGHPVETEGVYRFDLIWNDQVIAQARLEITLLEE